jgi:hypothetical protein
MIIKSLAQLAQPDEASLVIRPLDIDPASVAEGVAEYRQRLVAGFELVDGVPETTRASYERVRTIYSYGIMCYELYTVAGNEARLVVEQTLRDRFLPFYQGTVTFLDGSGAEHPVTTQRFDDLYDRDSPLVKKNWRRLKLQSGRAPIEFNGMLTSLLRWAREEGLLGGQRDRWQDRFRVWFRNYTAHPHHHLETPDDAASEIFHLADLINRLWEASRNTPVRREVMAVAWTRSAITYGLAEGFQIPKQMPADATCAVVLADPYDRTLGNSLDTQYEMTARPCDYLWGPGTWQDGAEWVGRQQPTADEVTTLDRLFFLRYHQKRLYMPRSIGLMAGLDSAEKFGQWYILRADFPFDAFAHQRQILSSPAGHTTVGFCRECPVENITSGTWQEMIDYCTASGMDVTPRQVPDLRPPLCRIPRWNELTSDGQWVFSIA